MCERDGDGDTRCRMRDTRWALRDVGNEMRTDAMCQILYPASFVHGLSVPTFPSTIFLLEFCQSARDFLVGGNLAAFATAFECDFKLFDRFPGRQYAGFT